MFQVIVHALQVRFYDGTIKSLQYTMEIHLQIAFQVNDSIRNAALIVFH